MPVRSLATLLAAAAAGTLLAQTTQEQLERKLGRNPVELLRVLGDTKSDDEARQQAHDALQGLPLQDHLPLLRLGLGSSDERVVFGVLALTHGVLTRSGSLAVPELRHAARLVLPRLGDPDCPVEHGSVTPLLGSVDMAATAAPLRKLAPADAVKFLDELHRLLRSEHIPLLCRHALATEGAVRKAVFANARLAAEFSNEHVPLLVKTWLQIRGASPDPDGDGLPGVLAAALRTHLDAPPRRELARRELDDRDPPLPLTPCMRWLLASRTCAADLPLLQRVVRDGHRRLRHGALWLLAGTSDDESLQFLRGLPLADVDLSLRMALARRGVDTKVDELLDADKHDAVAAGLAVASPARRRAFVAAWLAAEPAVAIGRCKLVRPWIGGKALGFQVPPYDDSALADVEPMAAAAKQLDARVLRELIAVVPGCATARLADRLLDHPAAQLFAPPPGEDEPEPDWARARGDLGYAGVWPFLEVTRPDAFRRRLHEGLFADAAPVRALCAELLVQLGDASDLAPLVAWLDEQSDPRSGWLQLARNRDRAVVELLRKRVAAAKDANDAWSLLPALAAGLGMPFDFAREWQIADGNGEQVRKALLRGDSGDLVEAFLCSIGTRTDFDPSWARLAAWQEPRVQDLLRDRRTRTSPYQRAGLEFEWALHSHDEQAIAAADALVRDGRLALHYDVSRAVLSHDRSLATLAFWIGELGGNCCRAVVADDVMKSLFGTPSHAFDCADMAEPAVVRLRRRLLPLQSRLRWSRIADAYVVAGT